MPACQPVADCCVMKAAVVTSAGLHWPLRLLRPNNFPLSVGFQCLQYGAMCGPGGYTDHPGVRPDPK